MLVRLTLFTVTAIAIAYAAHMFFGSIIFAAAEEDASAIVLRDIYKNERHELSGIVMVPSTCHDLTVRAKDIDARSTAIILETWEQPFASACDKAPTPRAIHVTAFGPEGLDLRGMQDGAWVPLTIIETRN
ncbi:hypothetical protein HY413_02410 [Candidatus Kaiserbacteria bacterium]|nr:hypothetical protein [Candidatus Kaiserbacteria bacterium]